MSVSIKKIVDNLMEGIKFYINERFKTAPYDRTDTAIIKGISEFGYVIGYNNTLYSDIKTIGGTCSINETVKIMIPQNNMNNIFILKAADITTLENNFINQNKITNSGVVNVSGYVADARQLNPDVPGSLGEKIDLLDIYSEKIDNKTVYNWYNTIGTHSWKLQANLPHLVVLDHSGGSGFAVYLVIPDTQYTSKIINIGGAGQTNWDITINTDLILTVSTTLIPYWSVSISKLTPASIGSITPI